MAEVSLKKYEISKGTKALSWACIFIGLITFLVGLKVDSERMWHAYLVAYFFFVSLSLGGLFFTAISNLTNAGWSVSVRRISEAFTAYLPYAVLLTIPLLVGAKDLYTWLDPEVVAADSLLQGKASYLNQGFFHIRLLAFFAMWLFFAWKIVTNSIKQDETGEESYTHSNAKLSIAFVLVFALSYSLYSVDLMMSLEAHWFSTMFGVYTFSGLFQSFMAMMCLFTIYMIKKDYLKGFADENHVHDLAKYMWAFTIFYAYIGFCQFMLIWYANLPEETIFFMHRTHGAWFWISVSLVVFKFIVPFLALAPRAAKRNFCHVRNVAILILITQFVDNYWLVYPNLDHDKAVFSFWEIGVFLGFLGLFLLQVHMFLAKNNIVAIKDPRLHESTHHHI